MKQTDGSKQHILLFGVSSSGKSTISKYFVEHGFVHIGLDDYVLLAQKEFYSSLDTDKYYAKDEFQKMYINNWNKVMYDESYKHDWIIYDTVDQKILQFYKDQSNIFVIVVYTSLLQLVDNIYSRRIDDPRELFVFDQFVKYFVRANSTDSNIVDLINKNDFITKLKSKLKYLFESEDDLIKFVDKIFLTMDISDDKEYPIKLRDTVRCDYLINTHDKNPDEIFKQIKNDLSEKIQFKF